MAGPLPLGAVVFDLDGVLVDSEPLHCRAIREIVEPLGVSFGDDEYERELMGLDDGTLIRRACELRGRRISAAQLAERKAAKTEAFARILRAGVTSCPGALELLQEVSGRLPVGLCSGSCRAEVELLLEGLARGARSLFRTIVSADDVSASKPDPEGYTRATAALGVPPESCLAIEDTRTGIRAAHAAGLRVLGVGPPGERLAGAERVVASLAGVGLDELQLWFR